MNVPCQLAHYQYQQANHKKLLTLYHFQTNSIHIHNCQLYLHYLLQASCRFHCQDFFGFHAYFALVSDQFQNQWLILQWHLKKCCFHKILSIQLCFHLKCLQILNKKKANSPNLQHLTDQTVFALNDTFFKGDRQFFFSNKSNEELFPLNAFMAKDSKLKDYTIYLQFNNSRGMKFMKIYVVDDFRSTLIIFNNQGIVLPSYITVN